MARSETDIETAMDTDKAATPALSVLTNTSGYGLWQLFRNIVAKAIRLHELMFDQHTSDVNAIAARAFSETQPWLLAMVKAFQYGDIIQILPNYTVAYAVVDPAKQIISQAAIVKLNGVLTIKAITASGPLTSDQLNGLQAYMNKVSFTTDLVCISLNPDVLQIQGNFYYDPEIDIATVKASVDAVGNAFLANIVFDGKFYNSKFEAILETCAGYIDFQPTLIQASEAGGGSYTVIPRVYNPVSGVLNYDTPLSDQLTFIPNV